MAGEEPSAAQRVRRGGSSVGPGLRDGFSTPTQRAILDHYTVRLRIIAALPLERNSWIHSDAMLTIR